MDPIIKEKWVKALRSGKYKQATDTLHDEDTGANCCLGVLCRINRLKRDGDKFYSRDGLEMYGSLDPYYLQIIGLPDGLETKLIEMNDSGSPFSEIADYIEEHL